MAVSKKGQGSSNACPKTANAKRRANKTTKTATRLIHVKTEQTSVPKEVAETCTEWLWYAVVVAAAVACYAKTPFGELVHDDIFAIERNADIRPEAPISALFLNDYWGKSLKSPDSHKSYRPLCVLSFRAQFWLHGSRPFGYRFVNVLLHIAVCLSLVRLCDGVLACSKMFSVMIGLVFAVHPIHAEAVNAIVGRADMLACFLFILAFKSYARCVGLGSTQTLVDKNYNKVASSLSSKTSKIRWKYLVLCVVFGSAAMLAKENGVTVFGVCIFYDIMVIQQCHLLRLTKKRTSKFDNKLIKRVIILISVVSTLLCFRMHLQNGEVPNFSTEENPASNSDSWLTRLLTYSYLCFFNASLLLVPTTLCYDWQMGSIPLVESLLDIRNLATVFFFVILVCLFVISAASSILNESERKIILIGLLLLTIPFLPASNVLLTVGFVVAERILYMPSLGYCILINFAFAKLAGISINAKDENLVCWAKTARCRVTAVLYVLFLGCLSWKTWQQSNVWQTRETLFRSGVETLPQNAKVHYNYANYLKDVQRNDEAIHHYNAALNLSADHSSSHNNLGTLLGNSEEAVKHFELAIRYDPQHSNAHFNLGNLFSIQNKLNESEKHLSESLRLNPQSVKTMIILADVLRRQGRINEADKLYKQSVLETPHDAIVLWNSYGVFLANNGRYEEALVYYDKAITLSPGYSVILINKARVLVMLGKLEVAVSFLKRFLERDKDPTVLHQLGVVYYKLNRILDAEKAWKDAIEIDSMQTETLYNYAILLKTQGRKEEAFAFLGRCLKSEPNSVEVNKDVIAVLHAMGYLKEALKTVDDALLVFKDPVFLYQKGNILKDLNLYQESITAYKMALNIDPKFVDVYLNMGAVYHVLGKFDYAKFFYEHVLALDPLNKLAEKNLGKLTVK